MKLELKRRDSLRAKLWSHIGSQTETKYLPTNKLAAKLWSQAAAQLYRQLESRLKQ